MATKFIQDKYDRVKVKKNEPQSSIDKKRPRVVVEKEAVETTSSTLALQEPRVASPIISIEELTPRPKKFQGGDKGKDKVGISVWEDPAIALGSAHNVVTTADLKKLSQVPSHELVNHHIHKLVQVFLIHKN